MLIRLLGQMVLALALVNVAVAGFPLAANGAPQGPIRIVALGDSLTAGYGVAASEALPAVLEKLLQAKGHAVEIQNAGVSGDTSAGGLARLDWAVPDGTDAVILALGANDMLSGLPPARPRANLDAIITRLKERGIEVLLAGVHAARNLGDDYVKEFDRIYPDLAQKHRIPLYPFLLEGVALNGALNQPDGIHPTAEGVRRIAAAILPTVEKLAHRVAERRTRAAR